MMRISPIYKTELRINVRSKKMVVLILSFNLILAAITLYSLYFNFEAKEIAEYSTMLNIYALIVTMLFTFCILIVPGVTASSITSEREKQTIGILLSTNVSTIDIVISKLISSISQVMLLIISSMPIVSLIFLIGGVTFMNMIEMFLLLMVTTVYVGSISLFWSAVAKRSLTATICAYCSIFGIMFLTLIPNMIAIFTNPKINFNVFEFWRYSEQMKYVPGMGSLLYNPLASLVVGLNNQLGGVVENLRFYGEGKLQSFILKHWYELSLVVQMTFSLGFITISNHILKKKETN